MEIEEELSDLDSDEAADFLLPPAEVEAKTRVWMTMNKDYLEAQAEKEKELEELRAQGKKVPERVGFC